MVAKFYEPDKARRLNGTYDVVHSCGHSSTRKVSYKSRFSAQGLSERYASTTALCKRCKYTAKLDKLREKYAELSGDGPTPSAVSVTKLGVLCLRQNLESWIRSKKGHPQASAPFSCAASSLVRSLHPLNELNTYTLTPKHYWVFVLTSYELYSRAPDFIRAIMRSVHTYDRTAMASVDNSLAVYNYLTTDSAWSEHRTSIYKHSFFELGTVAGLLYVCEAPIEKMPSEMSGPFGWLAVLRLSGQFEELQAYGIRMFKHTYLDEPLLPGDLSEETRKFNFSV